MIKVCIFRKSNNISRFVIFKKFSEIIVMCLPCSVQLCAGRLGPVVNVLCLICEVTLHHAWLILGWMGDRWQMGKPSEPPRSTQPGDPFVGSRNEYQQKPERKKAHRMRLVAPRCHSNPSVIRGCVCVCVFGMVQTPGYVPKNPVVFLGTPT